MTSPPAAVPPAPALGIIADDFTGAVMVAGMIEGAGLAAPVRFPAAGGPAPPGAAALVAATRARTVPRAEALAMIEAAGRALQAAGCARLAYKACASFDSTEDGNIGPAADWLAAQAGARPVLLSAGFPRFGATVHQGYLFYRNRLVTESVKRLDPLTPMPDPDLARFLQRQTAHPVALIPHLTLVQGLGAAQAALARHRAAGAGHVLLDTSDDGDVAIGAALAAARGLPVAASDPLIVALALQLGGAAASPAEWAAPCAPGDPSGGALPPGAEEASPETGPETAGDPEARVGSNPAPDARPPVGAGAFIRESDPLSLRRSDTGPRPGLQAEPARDRAPGPALVLAGSTGPVVLEQLEALATTCPLLTLDLLDPRPPAAQVADALDWAAAQTGPIAVSTATDAAGLARSQAAFGALEAARRAEALLAGIAAGLHRRGCRRFVVAGGETSGAVVAALGAGWMRALPEGPLGLGACVGLGPQPLSLLLKPGKLGPPDILLRAATAERF